MIISENLSGYIKSFVKDLSSPLAEIEEYGLTNRVPIIKKDAQSVLRFVLDNHRPENVLEVGTAIGFSSLLMCELCNNIKHIDTLEKDEERISIASDNINKLNKTDVITIIAGDADDNLKKLVEDERLYDFIFLDAAKAQYPEYLKSINSLLKPGGALLTDNILQEGSLCESKFSVARRDRTIHLRMRSFMDEIMNSPLYTSLIIPVGDGMLYSVRKG